MSKLSKIFSIVLIILLITAFTTPAASAAPEKLKEPELGAAQFLSLPVVLFISGVTICVTGESVVDIGKMFGLFWDGVRETGNKFVSEVSKQSNDYVKKEEWVEVTSEKVNKILIDLSLGGDGTGAGGRKSNGEDDEPYYFPERIEYEEGEGKVVKIQVKPINMREAAARVENGEDMMTLKREWGQDLFRKVSKKNGASDSEIKKAIDNSEIHNKGKKSIL